MKEVMQTLGIYLTILIAIAVMMYSLGASYASNTTTHTTHATYIKDVGCMVNIHKDTPITEINTNMVWCMEQHLNYIAEEK